MPRKVNIENIARRKAQIVRAAVKAFAKTGLKETSMDDIVRESGMSKGAIYWYFNSKDEIISGLINEFFDPDEMKILEAYLNGGTATERLHRFTEYMIREMDKMRKYRPIIQDLFAIAFRDQKIRSMTKKTFRPATSLMESIIREGIKNSEFRKVDPYQVTLAIYEIIEGTALFWSLDLIDVDFEKQLRVGIGLIVDSIKVRRNTRAVSSATRVRKVFRPAK